MWNKKIYSSLCLSFFALSFLFLIKGIKDKNLSKFKKNFIIFVTLFKTDTTNK